MNTAGVMLLLAAAALAVVAAGDVRATRTVGRYVPSAERVGIAAAAATSMASVWCLVIGLWLVVTR